VCRHNTEEDFVAKKKPKTEAELFQRVQLDVDTLNRTVAVLLARTKTLEGRAEWLESLVRSATESMPKKRTWWQFLCGDIL
jgi:hypothetical protein